jgi:hypothetical protein
MSTRVTSPALYWQVDEVDYDQRPKSRLQHLPLSVNLLWLKSTEVLSCTPSLEVVLN